MHLHRRPGRADAAVGGDAAPPEGDTKLIRVVSSGRKAADIMSLTPAKLLSLVGDLADAGVPGVDRRSLLAFSALAERVRADEGARAAPGAVPILANRQLLYDGAVVPVGRNLSADGGGGASDDENARAPRRRPLWDPAPGKGSRGVPYAAWARGAAPEDRLYAGGFAVLLSALGRGRTQLATDPRARVGLLDALSAFEAGGEALSGAWGPELLVFAAALAAAAGEGAAAPVDRSAARARARVVGLPARAGARGALASLADAAAAFLPAGPASAELFPGTAGTPGAGDAPAAEDAAALSLALNTLYDFAASSAGVALVSFLRGFARAEEELAPIGALLGQDGALLAPDPLEAGVVALRPPGPEAAEAAGVYGGAVVWLLAEVERVAGAPYHRPQRPMAAVTSLLAAGMLDTLHDMLRAARAAPARKRAQAFAGAAAPSVRRLAERREAARSRLDARRREQEEVVRARQLLIIIERRLGGARHDAVMKFVASDPIRYDGDNPETILLAVARTAPGDGKVAARDREVVETEYENLRRSWELEAQNDCAHVAAVRRLRAATSVQDEKRALAAVEALADARDAAARDSFVRCANCRFPLVCPHVLEAYRLRFRGVPYEQMRVALDGFVNRVPYAGSADTKVHGFAYYCKICSEELYMRTESGVGGISADDSGAGYAGRYDDFGGGLRKFLWVQTVRTLEPQDPRGGRRSARPLLRFSQPVQPRRFAEEAAAVCLPEALRAGLAAGLSAGLAEVDGTREGESAEASAFRLHAVVVLYAYFFVLVVGPRGDATRVGVEGVRDGAAPDAYARALLTHLVQTHSLLVSRMRGVTHEQIGNQFQLAYRGLLDAHGRVLLHTQDSSRVLATSLTAHNPYFGALRTAVSVRGPGGDKAAFPPRAGRDTTPKQAADVFRHIMGETLPEIVSWVPPDGLGPFVRASLARRGSFDLPEGAPPGWAHLLPAIAMFRASWGSDGDGASARGAAARYWRKPPGAVADGAGFFDGLFLLVRYSTAVYDDATLAAYGDVLAAAAARSRVRGLVQDLRRVPAVGALAPGPPRGAAPAAAVTRLYDEDGAPHRWDVYLWGDEGGEPRALRRGEFSAAFAAGELAGLRFVDWKCSVCGVRWSRTDSLDAAAALARVRARTQVEDFFRYFESRCPEGGLHSFGDAGGKTACRKCGVPTALLLPAGRRDEPRRALEYYEAHAGAFRDAAELGAGDALPDAPAPAPAPAPTPDVPGRDYARVAALVALMQAAGLGVTAAEVESLGAHEGRSAEDVRAGADAPAPPEKAEDPRLYAADAAVGDLVTRYYVLARALRVAPTAKQLAQNPWLRPLMAREDFGGVAGSASPGDALDLRRRYSAPREMYMDAALAPGSAERRAEWARAVLAFSIETLCVLAVEIAAVSPLMEDFVVGAMRDLFLSESRMTVAGQFEWSILFGERDSRGHANLSDLVVSMSADDSTNDDVRGYGPAGSESEDALARGERGRSDEDGTFSYDALDVDRETIESNM